MASNASAQTYHEQLFPGIASTLAVSDPEFIETFDNFAFDEVPKLSTLDIRTRLMVQLAALIGCQALSEYRVMLGAALTNGITPLEAKEILYQTVPYMGIGRVFDFIHTTNEVMTARGIALPLPGQSTTNASTRASDGITVQGKAIGEATVTQLYDNAPADLLHIQKFLSDNCFGDTYTRNGLDLATRELLTLSILVAQGGCDPQVKGHVAANLHVGNDRAKLIDVLTQLLPFIGYPRTLNGIAMLNEVAPPA